MLGWRAEPPTRMRARAILHPPRTAWRAVRHTCFDESNDDSLIPDCARRVPPSALSSASIGVDEIREWYVIR